MSTTTKEPTDGPLDAAHVEFFGQLSAYTVVVRKIASNLLAEGGRDDAQVLKAATEDISEAFYGMVDGPGSGLEEFKGQLHTSTGIVGAVVHDLHDAGVHSYARPLEAACQNVRRAFEDLRRKIDTTDETEEVAS